MSSNDGGLGELMHFLKAIKKAYRIPDNDTSGGYWTATMAAITATHGHHYLLMYNALIEEGHELAEIVKGPLEDIIEGLERIRLSVESDGRLPPRLAELLGMQVNYLRNSMITSIDFPQEPHNTDDSEYRASQPDIQNEE